MKFFLLVLLTLPDVVFAQGAGLGALLDSIYSVVALLIPVAFTLAVLYFFWGVTEYIRKANEGAIEQGRAKMFWGVIGLFVIASIWGVLSFFGQDFGFDIHSFNTSTPAEPNPCLDVQNRVVPYEDDPGCVKSSTGIPRVESERLLEEGSFDELF